MKLKHSRVVAALLGLGSLSVAVHAGTRIQVALDDGSTVTVDNISTYPETTVRTLVLAADRSTQDGCPYDAPNRKGLIRSGDRVVISNAYVAWLDMTVTDGAGYPGGDSYARSGALAGYWTLNPQTASFRFLTPASGSNCWNWPRNELIPGSASPSGQKYWWDRYAPPTEHNIEVIARQGATAAEDRGLLYTANGSQLAPNGGWAMDVDGQHNADGSVYFRAKGKMATGVRPGNGSAPHHCRNFQVALLDACTQPNGQPTVETSASPALHSELEYYFRAQDIMIGWRFKADVTVSARNVFVFQWMAYANGQDMDGASCAIPPTSGWADRWPAASFTQSWYAQSSAALRPNFATQGSPAHSVFAAQTPVKMVNAPRCNAYNHDINTANAHIQGNNDVVSGTWLRVGESNPPYSANKPFMTFVNLTPSTGGDGSKTAPYPFKWNRMLAWNEAHLDGTLGAGFASGPFAEREKYTTLLAGKWYYHLHALSSSY